MPSPAAQAATQASVDAMWSGITSRLNKKAGLAMPTAPSDIDQTPGAPNSGLLARDNAIGARRRAPATQASVDAMWSEIAACLNAEAGLETPARARR